MRESEKKKTPTHILRKQKSHPKPTLQHQPVKVSESEPPESALEHPLVFFKRCGPPGPTRDFLPKKLQDV